MALDGVKDCKSNGSMQARNVNSSDNGATMWFRIHTKFCMLDFQYEDSVMNENKCNY